MKSRWYALYNLVLALWVGGMALFTFIVTPAIFKSFHRDAAAEIVGELFPGYFLSTMVLAVLAYILFFTVADDRKSPLARFSQTLLVLALVINAVIVFKLEPAAYRARQQVSSFEKESLDAPARQAFARLHALSAVLNLVLLADGVFLIMTGTALRKTAPGIRGQEPDEN